MLFEEKPSVVRPTARGRGKLGFFWGGFIVLFFHRDKEWKLNSQSSDQVLPRKEDWISPTRFYFLKIISFEKMLLDLRGFFFSSGAKVTSGCEDPGLGHPIPSKTHVPFIVSCELR